MTTKKGVPPLKPNRFTPYDLQPFLLRLSIPVSPFPSLYSGRLFPVRLRSSPRVAHNHDFCP